MIGSEDKINESGLRYIPQHPIRKREDYIYVKGEYQGTL